MMPNERVQENARFMASYLRAAGFSNEVAINLRLAMFVDSEQPELVRELADAIIAEFALRDSPNVIQVDFPGGAR